VGCSAHGAWLGPAQRGGGAWLPVAHFAAGREPRSLAVGDLDQDGHLDLVTANYAANTISVLRGVGKGSFLPRVDFGAGNGPEAVALGLFDGDARPDLVVAASTSNGAWLLGNRTGGTSGVAPRPDAAGGVRLLPSRPNPAAPATTLSFELAAAGPARLDLFDARGRRVRRLLDAARLAAGLHPVAWDGRDDRGRIVAAGRYYGRLAAGGSVVTRAIVVVN
jgi:hypothetical protein